MFDVGFGELLVIALVALVVLGPERLPGAARTLGALLRRARASWNDVRSEVERELHADELRRQMRDAAQAVHQAGASVRADVDQVAGEVHAAVGVATGAPVPPTHADATAEASPTTMRHTPPGQEAPDGSGTSEVAAAGSGAAHER